MISELVEPSQQIFIATHSADFLRGLLSSTRDAVIIHLDRIADITKANVLDSATLDQIVTDSIPIKTETPDYQIQIDSLGFLLLQKYFLSCA